MSETQSDNQPRVVPFPGVRNKTPRPPKADDLSDYTAKPEPVSEYRQRMLVNAAVFLVVLALIGAALWLADTMATMRKNQDCVLSGRPGCTHVDSGPSRRW
jgi:hypothetical protein